MANELKNIRISLISLVGKAANKTTFIYKSSDGGAELRRFDIIKKDDEKRLVYGIVYPAGKVDAQNDFATPEEVEKAAHNFMQSLESTEKIDTGHNLQIAKGVKIVESYVVKKGDEMYLNDEGAWAIVVKVDNDEIWGQITDGTFTGFSMWGEAERIAEEVSKEEMSMMKNIFSVLKKVFNSSGSPIKTFEDDNFNVKEMENKIQIAKDFNAMIAAQDVREYIWTLRDSFDQIYNDAAVVDKKTAILANIDQFKAKIESVDIAKGILAEIMKDGEIDIEKAGKVLSEANLAKLQAAIDNINSILENSKIQKMDEKIQKQIDDAVESAKVELQKANDAKITELNGEIDKLKKENEDLKTKSPGSGQGVADPAKVEKEDDGINFLGR